MTTLGDYELEAEIGRGGMGRVYRARHLRTGAVRAVKTLEHAGDVESILRFRREAEALARVGGAVAVPIHESGTERGRFYFAMDLMPGGSLRERVGREGHLPWREAVALGATLARGLAVLHDHGLVHRDLKPANILFADDGAPRIADLGCVRDVSSASLTASGTILGTLAYMAPEQLRGERVGPPADVFALGVILHELIAGAPLFEGSPARQLSLRSEVGKRARLETTAGTPRALDALLDRALDRDERARPQARELGDLLASLPGADKGKARDHRAFALAALGLVALALVVLALAALAIAARDRRARPGPDPSPPSSPPARPTPSPPTVPERVKALLEGRAAITSADVPTSDLRALVEGRQGGLIEALAVKGALYSLTDIEDMKCAPPHPAKAPLALLWAYSALASRDPARRVEAALQLEAAGPTYSYLAGTIRAVDRIAGGASSEPLSINAPKDAPIPPATLGGLLDPLEKECRDLAFRRLARQLAAETASTEVAAQDLKGILLPSFGKLTDGLRAELVILDPAIVRKLAGAEVQARWDATSPRTEIGGDLPARDQGLLEAPLRRFGSMLSRTAGELTPGADPLFEAAIRAQGLSFLEKADRFAGEFDPTFAARVEAALADLSRRSWSEDEDTRSAVNTIRHQLETALVEHEASRAACLPEGDERRRLAALALEHAARALTLLPPRAPDRHFRSEMREFDAHAAVRAWLLLGRDPAAIPEDLKDDLFETDWIRLELLRREGKPEEAISLATKLEGVNPADRSPFWPFLYVGSVAVRALCRIELGKLDAVDRDLAILEPIAPGALELPDLKPRALRRRLEDARAGR